MLLGVGLVVCGTIAHTRHIYLVDLNDTAGRFILNVPLDFDRDSDWRLYQEIDHQVQSGLIVPDEST